MQANHQPIDTPVKTNQAAATETVKKPVEDNVNLAAATNNKETEPVVQPAKETIKKN